MKSKNCALFLSNESGKETPQKILNASRTVLASIRVQYVLHRVYSMADQRDSRVMVIACIVGPFFRSKTLHQAQHLSSSCSCSGTRSIMLSVPLACSSNAHFALLSIKPVCTGWLSSNRLAVTGARYTALLTFSMKSPWTYRIDKIIIGDQFLVQHIQNGNRLACIQTGTHLITVPDVSNLLGASNVQHISNIKPCCLRFTTAMQLPFASITCVNEQHALVLW